MTKYYFITEKSYKKDRCYRQDVDNLYQGLLNVRNIDTSKIERITKAIDNEGHTADVNIDIHITLDDLNNYTPEQLLLSGLGSKLSKL